MGDQFKPGPDNMLQIEMPQLRFVLTVRKQKKGANSTDSNWISQTDLSPAHGKQYGRNIACTAVHLNHTRMNTDQ